MQVNATMAVPMAQRRRRGTKTAMATAAAPISMSMPAQPTMKCQASSSQFTT